MKYNKSFWICLGAAAAVMLFLPWALCLFAGPTDIMGIAWLLFFAVNPLCAAAVGVFAGLRLRERWTLPAWCALLYLMGAWLAFAMGETAFFWYAGAYLLLGVLFMLPCAWIRKKTAKA